MPMRVSTLLRPAAVAGLCWLLAAPALAADITTPAKFALIMDHDSGVALYEKNADAPMKPASMAKVMTVYLLFRQLEEGGLGPDDTFVVSERAYRMGGSRSFLEIGSEVSVMDLLRGIIVQSGNDASVVVAEGLAGTEEAFAGEMTRVARQLGMVNTTFGNSSGWPDEATTTTARDLAILTQTIIDEFPDLYKLFAEREFTYNGIKQGNRNPLLYGLAGADGLKTGHTEESGYGLMASVIRNGQRVTLVMNGLGSNAERRSEGIRLVNTAFRVWQKRTILDENDILGNAAVNMGVEGSVPVASAAKVERVASRSEFDGLTRRLELDPNIDAPVAKGQELGHVVVQMGARVERHPVVATKAVEELPFFGKIWAFFYRLVFGHETPLPGTG